MSYISDFLKNTRIEKKLTLKELSYICGVGPSTISDIETGTSLNPRMGTLQKLANALEVSVNDFFENENTTIIEKTTPIKKNVDIEKQKQIDTVAAHLEDKNLTPKKVKLLKDYIDALFDDEDW
ncbi:helix-turn-helix domain-containing protein [Clostridium uliginosum]|uniref:Transcriptional regulator, contains XRE-family HTH domain n=1 Tax=Clostridium uliginosum TaxID=119641 RepID=A0A1I1KRC3_9CLOT|nr:helix-turn-helix transcriptional regulator [Clostridium uliginosum]SFC63337.1 Transcriptional regulator, contains XRE-family HTH domain [Clostridium uliginosum]